LLAVVNALFYIARTGCQWRLLPGDFPHYSTAQRYFYAWRDDGTLQRINFELLVPRNAERHQIGLLGDIIADSRATSPGK
jgi:transposase